MKRRVVTSKVGSDGVLHLALPLGVEEADKEIMITVDLAIPKKVMIKKNGPPG